MRIHVAEIGSLFPCIPQGSSHGSVSTLAIWLRLGDMQPIPRHAISAHLHHACSLNTSSDSSIRCKLTHV